MSGKKFTHRFKGGREMAIIAILLILIIVLIIIKDENDKLRHQELIKYLKDVM